MQNVPTEAHIFNWHVSMQFNYAVFQIQAEGVTGCGEYLGPCVETEQVKALPESGRC